VAWQVVRGLEDLVNGVHQDASDYFSAIGAALHCDDEVVNKDVGIWPVASATACWKLLVSAQEAPRKVAHLLRKKWAHAAWQVVWLAAKPPWQA